MKIVVAYPPNIEKIISAFGELPKNVVFAYGEILFNPSDGPIDEPLRIHELTHVAQQGKDVEGWWDNYINRSQFRFEQELEAFSNQYNCYRTFQKDRNRVAKYLTILSYKLASPMYGNLTTSGEALRLIKQHADSGYRTRK